MTPKWKKSITATIERAGWMANKHYVDNAHQINEHEHYNGSGSKHFGGADKWPVLEVQISFQVGQEDLRHDLAEKIRKLIDETLPK